MYRGAETSSSFYRSMREAFAGDVAVGSNDTSVGRATIADIQHRLNAIGRPASSSAHLVLNATGTSDMKQVHETARVALADFGGNNLRDSAAPVIVGQSAAPHRSSSSQHPPVGVDDDETLTPQELRSLRMIEIAQPVRVLLGELHHPAKPLQLLAEEANVRIFPRHIFISRPHNGAPIAEIVILELSELTEDDQRGTLSFYIRKPNDQSTTIVEVYCADGAARSAMYKIICSKRTALEADGPRSASRSA